MLDDIIQAKFDRKDGRCGRFIDSRNREAGKQLVYNRGERSLLLLGTFFLGDDTSSTKRIGGLCGEMHVE